MIVSRRRGSRLIGASLVALLALPCGCAQSGGATAETNATSTQAEVASAPLPASSPANPFADDVSKLSFRDRADTETLVSSTKGTFITVGEFNAWLGSYPLRITAEDLPGAQRQALEQMVAFKLLVEKARAAGYEERVGPRSDQKTLVVSYLRDQMSDVATISDQAVQRYEDDHPEVLAQLGPEVPPEIRMMALKGSIRGEQLWARVEDWMKDAGIRYEETRTQ
jgi:hypothetical protein